MLQMTDKYNMITIIHEGAILRAESYYFLDWIGLDYCFTSHQHDIVYLGMDELHRFLQCAVTRPMLHRARVWLTC